MALRRLKTSNKIKQLNKLIDEISSKINEKLRIIISRVLLNVRKR